MAGYEKEHWKIITQLKRYNFCLSFLDPPYISPTQDQVSIKFFLHEKVDEQGQKMQLNSKIFTQNLYSRPFNIHVEMHCGQW